jgi:uncharacterized membrane protein YbhN (UPF0104 family)
MPLVAVAVVVGVIGLALLARARPEGTRSVWRRLLSGTAGDIRRGLLAPRAWPGIALTSVLGIAGHAATFLIAARAAGVSAPVSQMLPIAFLVMAAMMLPSVGGWGPREGVTAWAFGAAGLGAQHGVTTAVVYGLMILVASLPGAAVLVLGCFRPDRHPEPLRDGGAHPDRRELRVLSDGHRDVGILATVQELRRA